MNSNEQAIGSKLRLSNTVDKTRRILVGNYCWIQIVRNGTYLFGLLSELSCHEHMNSKVLVKKLKINIIKYISSDGDACIQIFKQKFPDRKKILSHITQQSWYFPVIFSSKNKILYTQTYIYCFSFLDPEFDSNCRNCLKQHSGIFWEISHGCWHLQITCELEWLEGRPQEKAWIFERLSLKHCWKATYQTQINEV